MRIRQFVDCYCPLFHYNKNPASTFNSAFAAVLLLIYGSPLYADSKPVKQADFVKVIKSKRQLVLYRQGKVIKHYHVSLGDEPIGPKRQQGDEKTPEGKYTIDYRNPQSHYHLSLHINYPSAKDKKLAAKRGVKPGGDIFIHGLPNGMGALSSAFTIRDWTDGCIAVTNDEIEEIWRLVKNGTPIEIVP